MIYTLYSYKGGVGRSMALANLAECFFHRGLKVVMVDWDLEAPGLENYFYRDAAEVARVAARRGLIDMLLHYKETYPQIAQRRMPAGLAPAASAPDLAPDESSDEIARENAEVLDITRQFLAKHAARIPERLRTIAQPEPMFPADMPFRECLNSMLTPVDSYLEEVDRAGEGRLMLLTAGARTRERFGAYADAVQDFDWLEFLARYEGKEYLEWLREQLLAIADVVLIDSRTGVTEMSGVCTRQMADAVVSFCAPNSQNVDGVARIVTALGTESAKQARFDRDLQVLVIPTRIDDSESMLVGEFADYFDERLEIHNLPADLVADQLEGVDKPLWNLHIPYIPKFNYREQLVIPARAGDQRRRSDADADGQPDPPTRKLIKAYESLALHMALLAKLGDPLRQAYAAEIATQFPQLDPRKAPQMAPPLPSNWVERGAARSLRSALSTHAQAPHGGRIAVWGAAGMGKTTLVASACASPEVVEAFPDGIVWLTLDGPAGSERIQDFLRTSFGIPRQGGQRALAHALDDKKFLWVIDDVWTPEQLNDVFAWGKRCTRVIITRDFAIARAFADDVIEVGRFTRDECQQLLRMPGAAFERYEADDSLRWLLDWPLGASLLAAAAARNSVTSASLDRAWVQVADQLKVTGLKVLDRPDLPGRAGSIALTLGESIARLPPPQRRLLFDVAVGADAGDTPDARRLRELGLVDADGKVSEVLLRGRLGQGELTENAEARRLKERTEALQRGYEIVRGRGASLRETIEAATQARKIRAFSLARKLFALARANPEAAELPAEKRLQLIQQHALCTYKDDDLVANERFGNAMEILAEGDLHSTTTPSQETLGQAGAIHKNMWRLSGQRRDLERSLAYYARGAAMPLEGDQGYTRINAAFVLDMLAKQEQHEAASTAQARRAEATRLRDEVAVALPAVAAKPGNAWLKIQWWYCATMAEALFGLKRYPEARHWLREAIALDPPAWELESTTRQMAMLAFAQDTPLGAETEAWQTLAMLVGDAPQALHAITHGKVGLALSGGGFRASLFHIGVLARLAELDLLRHVEVLSCVSGGSIIGAHYYLEVRRLLQSKRDSEIVRDDYVEIVRRLERDFLAGVQMNLRARLFAGWRANLKSLVVRGYTRTTYLGEMFERYIYSRVADGEAGKRWLNALQVKPHGSQDFNPRLDNWRRAAKVPILLLNSTTLNTGHVWQFAVSWMGEPPQSAASSVDSNDLLRRMYYHEAPVRHRRVRLGEAVAASACVPALFDPVELHGLYPRRVLRLVDGGVHDNQGVAGLIEQECSVVLVSDASGQMNSEQKPSGNIVPVIMRSSSISMARVRETQYRELYALKRSSALNGLLFLHLKKDLDMRHVDWIDCQDPYDASANEQSRRGTTLTTYGIPKSIQELLAGLRTDLDTFCDAEAYALMLSGYRMASSELKAELTAFSVTEAPRVPWRFLAIEPAMDRATDYEPQHDRLRAILRVGAGQAFKAFRLRPFSTALSTAALLAAVVLVAGAGVLLWRSFSPLLPTLAGAAVGGAALGGAALLTATALLQRKNASVLVTGLVFASVGWLVARIHLWAIDPLYRRAGAVRGKGEASSARPRSYD